MRYVIYARKLPGLAKVEAPRPGYFIAELNELDRAQKMATGMRGYVKRTSDGADWYPGSDWWEVPASAGGFRREAFK